MEYFLKIAKSDKPVFLSANFKSEKVSPYMVKNINGVKIGIIGLTGLYAGNKAGLKVSEPVKKTAELIDQLKAKGVQVIIIISNLGEKEDLKLIAEVKGIDIVFVGQNPLKEEQISKVGSVFVLRPSWQGRKLGKLTLEIKNGILENCKAEQITLSDKIADDPNILKILPRCYSDSNCRKEGFVGVCNNPGDLKAECDFIMPSKITMKVITARDCAVCKSDQVVNSLKRRFPGLTVEYLYYPDQSTENLIKELSITALPVYIFGKDIEGEKGFENIKNDFIHRGDFYWLKPERSGLSFFIDRKKKSKELDLFFSIFDKDIDKLLNAVRDFKPELHFLAIEGGMGFDARKGNQEVGEYLRAVCMQKYQPQVLWDYLVCRAKNINDSDWESCAKGVNLTRVNKCAVGKEGQKLLRENISLNKELKILFGPVYLLNNQEIFSSLGVPDKEELERIIKK
jgi:hypothetical protein